VADLPSVLCRTHEGTISASCGIYAPHSSLNEKFLLLLPEVKLPTVFLLLRLLFSLVQKLCTVSKLWLTAWLARWEARNMTSIKSDLYYWLPLKIIFKLMSSVHLDWHNKVSSNKSGPGKYAGCREPQPGSHIHSPKQTQKGEKPMPRWTCYANRHSQFESNFPWGVSTFMDWVMRTE
jgi:hypothetical protein